MTTIPEICFKVTLQRKSGPTMHRFRGKFTWDEFQSVLGHLWSCRKLRVEYDDEDGDRITVGSSLEWEECIRLHLVQQERDQTSHPIKLNIIKVGGKESADSTAATVNTSVTALTADDVSVPVEPTVACCGVNVPRLALPSVNSRQPSRNNRRDVTHTGVEKHAMELLSLLYKCNASDELCNPFSALDLSAVVLRAVDPMSGEVRLDIDTRALRHAAIVEANRLMEAGCSAAAAELLVEAAKMYPHEMIIEYNLACAYSLSGNIDGAAVLLDASITDGYNNEQKIREDPDLAAIRADPRFAQLMAKHFPQEPSPCTAGLVDEAVAADEASTADAAAVPVAPVPSPVTTAVQEIAVDVPPPLTERTHTIMSIFPQLDAKKAKSLLNRHNNVVSIAVNAKLSE